MCSKRGHFFSYKKASHLSEGTSDLKTKWNTTPETFFGTVFHALSQCVICLVPMVRFRNHFIIDWNSPPANQKLQFFCYSNSLQSHFELKQQKLCIGFLLTNRQFQEVAHYRQRIFGPILPTFYVEFENATSSCDNLRPCRN